MMASEPQPSSLPVVLSEQDVYRYLDYDGCITAIRRAMADLSADPREQPLRQIVPLGAGKMFGVMPGVITPDGDFGAKLVSVFPDPASPGRSAHRGVVALFNGNAGTIRCLADAGAITHIRTACASAVATAELARADAGTLAVFGCGAQALSHVQAVLRVRPALRVGVWGRSSEAAQLFATASEAQTGIGVRVWSDPAELARQADIICTVTAASEPILKREWVRPGTHINAVGSSYAGPRELDNALVASSRYFVDYRASALVAAAEYLSAKEEGLIGDDHIAGEIGDVLSGRVEGRRSQEEITIYKSLGHIVQDLAAARYALFRHSPGEVL